ncbi:RES family NAD+ phosphorylase [Burkholderia multivorans]|uniref:RES family NAD+ phosphorylase n=1 Tax=Burkholderia multivorans TaxID=87883 RepID=UPI0021572991|nr:RES family NAD+ phosphorylase [Burkholderia multivorans]
MDPDPGERIFDVDDARQAFRERDTDDEGNLAFGASAHFALRHRRALLRPIGGNRFDDPRKRGRYGTCYFGFDLHCAFAETVLHDEVADLELGGFPLVTTELERYVLSFTGRPLNVAVLHGVPLKNLGGDGALSTVVPYDIPQQWSAAVYRHRQHVDGFLYMSRHLNTSEALVLFDRAAPRLAPSAAVPFRDHPAAARVLRDFNILPR